MQSAVAAPTLLAVFLCHHLFLFAFPLFPSSLCASLRCFLPPTRSPDTCLSSNSSAPVYVFHISSRLSPDCSTCHSGNWSQADKHCCRSHVFSAVMLSSCFTMALLRCLQISHIHAFRPPKLWLSTIYLFLFSQRTVSAIGFRMD